MDCAKCGTVLSGAVPSFNGKDYHVDCFTCAVCSTVLSTRAKLLHGEPACVDCWRNVKIAEKKERLRSQRTSRVSSHINNDENGDGKSSSAAPVASAASDSVNPTPSSSSQPEADAETTAVAATNIKVPLGVFPVRPDRAPPANPTDVAAGANDAASKPTPPTSSAPARPLTASPSTTNSNSNSSGSQRKPVPRKPPPQPTPAQIANAKPEAEQEPASAPPMTVIVGGGVLSDAVSKRNRPPTQAFTIITQESADIADAKAKPVIPAAPSVTERVPLVDSANHAAMRTWSPHRVTCDQCRLQAATFRAKLIGDVEVMLCGDCKALGEAARRLAQPDASQTVASTQSSNADDDENPRSIKAIVSKARSAGVNPLDMLLSSISPSAKASRGGNDDGDDELDQLVEAAASVKQQLDAADAAGHVVRKVEKAEPMVLPPTMQTWSAGALRHLRRRSDEPRFSQVFAPLNLGFGGEEEEEDDDDDEEEESAEIDTTGGDELKRSRSRNKTTSGRHRRHRHKKSVDKSAVTAALTAPRNKVLHNMAVDHNPRFSQVFSSLDVLSPQTKSGKVVVAKSSSSSSRRRRHNRVNREASRGRSRGASDVDSTTAPELSSPSPITQRSTLQRLKAQSQRLQYSTSPQLAAELTARERQRPNEPQPMPTTKSPGSRRRTNNRPPTKAAESAPTSNQQQSIFVRESDATPHQPETRSWARASESESLPTTVLVTQPSSPKSTQEKPPVPSKTVSLPPLDDSWAIDSDAPNGAPPSPNAPAHKKPGVSSPTNDAPTTTSTTTPGSNATTNNEPAKLVKVNSNGKSNPPPAKTKGSTSPRSPRALLGRMKKGSRIEPAPVPAPNAAQVAENEAALAAANADTSVPLAAMTQDEALQWTSDRLVNKGDPRLLYEVNEKRRLGKGGFGAVFWGKEIATGAPVAVKKMQINRRNKMEYLLIETELHAKSSHHPNIVTFIDSFHLVEEKEFWVVLEFIDGCTLEALLDLTAWREPQMAHVTREVCRALVYIHRMNRLHRDLKLGNVMIAPGGVIKLTDFGLAAQLTADREQRSTMVGTPDLVAPEIVEGHDYGVEVDIWALGMLVLKMCRCSPLLHIPDPHKVLQKLKREGAPRLTKKKFSDPMKDFITRTVLMDPKQRWTAQQLLEHEWLKTKPSTANFDKMLAVVRGRDKDGGCVIM